MIKVNSAHFLPTRFTSPKLSLHFLFEVSWFFIANLTKWRTKGCVNCLYFSSQLLYKRTNGMSWHQKNILKSCTWYNITCCLRYFMHLFFYFSTILAKGGTDYGTLKKVDCGFEMAQKSKFQFSNINAFKRSILGQL